VKSDDLVRVTGEVEYATNAEIVLYVRTWYSKDIPESGALTIDVEAAKFAIERQRAALEAVKFNRGIRSDLGKLCIHPEVSQEPLPIEFLSPVQPKLDAPKIKAVSAALAHEISCWLKAPLEQKNDVHHRIDPAIPEEEPRMAHSANLANPRGFG